MIVKCIRECWESKRNRHYYMGDQDDIDPLEPIAANFAFPAGTEVYYKKPGNKKEPAKSTTRIVPGAVAKKPEEPPKEETPETPEERPTRGRRSNT